MELEKVWVVWEGDSIAGIYTTQAEAQKHLHTLGKSDWNVVYAEKLRTKFVPYQR